MCDYRFSTRISPLYQLLRKNFLLFIILYILPSFFFVTLNRIRSIRLVSYFPSDNCDIISILLLLVSFVRYLDRPIGRFLVSMNFFKFDRVCGAFEKSVEISRVRRQVTRVYTSMLIELKIHLYTFLNIFIYICYTRSPPPF